MVWIKMITVVVFFFVLFFLSSGACITLKSSWFYYLTYNKDKVVTDLYWCILIFCQNSKTLIQSQKCLSIKSSDNCEPQHGKVWSECILFILHSTGSRKWSFCSSFSFPIILHSPHTPETGGQMYSQQDAATVLPRALTSSVDSHMLPFKYLWLWEELRETQCDPTC